MKKRILPAIMTIIMVLSAIPMGCLTEVQSLFDISAYATDADVLYYGDVDENGKITASDARTILRCAAGIQEITARQFEIADMNGDNKITAADARKILRTAASLDSPIVFGEEITATVDYLEIYTDFIKKQGKTKRFYASDYNEYITHDFCDAVICYYNEKPQLTLAYMGRKSFSKYDYVELYAYVVYSIDDNGTVKEVKTSYSGGYLETTTAYIWKDLLTGKPTFAIKSSSHEWSSFSNHYPKSNNVVSTEMRWNDRTSSSYYVNEYGTGYKTYLDGYVTTDGSLTSSVINKNIMYTFSKSPSDNIRITIIDENGLYETKTSSF